MINAGGQLSFDVPNTAALPLLEVYDGILQGNDIQFTAMAPNGIIRSFTDEMRGVVGAGAVTEISLGTYNGSLTTGSIAPVPFLNLYANGDLNISGLFASGATYVSNGGDVRFYANRDILVNPGIAGTIALLGCNCTTHSVEMFAGYKGFFGLQGPTGGNVILPTVNVLANNHSVALTATQGSSGNGAVSIGSIDVSGQAAKNGGTIQIAADKSVSTGFLKANGGQWTSTATKGGRVELRTFSLSAPVVVNGNIDISGGFSAAGVFGGVGSLATDTLAFTVTGQVFAGGIPPAQPPGYLSPHFYLGLPRAPGGVPFPPPPPPGSDTGGGSVPPGAYCPFAGPTTGAVCAGLVNTSQDFLATQQASKVTATGAIFSQSLTPTVGFGNLAGEFTVISSSLSSSSQTAGSLFNNSTATIQAREGKVARLLFPGEISDKSAQHKHKVDDIIKLATGDSMLFSAADLAEEELIPQTGTGDAVFGGAISRQNTQSSQQVTHNLVNGGFSAPQRRGKGHRVRPQTEPQYQYSKLLASADAVVQKNNESIELRQGSLFLHASEGAVHLTADQVQVKVARNALVHMEKQGSSIRVKALSGPNQVIVHVAGKSVVLHAGQELLVTARRPTVKEVFPEDGIGRRQLLAVGLDADCTAILADYSMVGMLAHHSHLRAVGHPQTGSARAVQHRILKTAAALDLITKNRGPFFSMQRKTAMNDIPEWAFKDDSRKNDLLALLH